MRSYIKKTSSRFQDILGLDFHVLLTLIFRGWGIVAGAVTLVMLPFWLSAAQQGYYYTFTSLIGLQVFFELGLSQIIVMLISNEAAHISISDDGALQGDLVRIKRVVGIVTLVRHWYRAAALIFAIIVSLVGFWFFYSNDQSVPVSDWAPVWCLLVFLSSINLFLSPQLAVQEGLGQVGQVARLRLIQSLLGYVSLWLLLVFNAQLWIVIAVPAVSAISSFLWLRKKSSLLIAVDTKSNVWSWKRDIFPLQWRIAISWVCGYFIFNSFTPVVFSSSGAIEAGRLGMGLSVFSAITTLGLSWVNAKVPVITMYVSRGDSDSLNRLFKFVAVRSTAATAFIGFSFVGMIAIGTILDISATNRIAQPNVLFWLACAAIANTLVYAIATYMRAHLEEPMLPISIASAILTICTIFIFRENVSHMIMSYAAVCTCIALPWTALVYRRYRYRFNIQSSKC